MAKSNGAICLLLLIITVLFTGCPSGTPEVNHVIQPSVIKEIDYDASGTPNSYIIKFQMFPTVKEVHFSPGGDSTVLTSDDRIAGYWYCTGSGENWRGSYKWQMGADSLWFTNDDVYPEYEATNASGIDTIWSCGADGHMGGSDDIMTGYWKDTYDANGNRLQRIGIKNAGGDLQWFTGDDAPGALTEWFGGMYYNAEYNNIPENIYWISMSRMVAYDGPGGNSIWFDGDDHVNQYRIHEFANGGYFCTKETTYNSIDGTAINGVKSGYATYAYSFENGAPDVTGTWSGIYYNTIISDPDWGTMTCTVSQTSGNISGTGTFHSENGNGDTTGDITGTLSGHTLTLICKEVAAPAGDDITVTAELCCNDIMGSFDFEGNLDTKGKGMFKLERN